MRRRRARLLAIVTGMAVLALAATFAGIRAARRPVAPSVAASPRGVEVYERLGCAACHALAGEGNSSHPLDGVGRRLSRDAIRTWIVAPQRMDPGVRKPAYDRVPAQDLDALVDYLSGS
jgi:mono/diheme cytochrome c family protein